MAPGAFHQRRGARSARDEDQEYVDGQIDNAYPPPQDRTSLEDLVAELRDRGITQKQIVEILGINSGLSGSAKRLEKRGRRYGSLNACKLARAYLPGVVERQGRTD